MDTFEAIDLHVNAGKSFKYHLAEDYTFRLNNEVIVIGVDNTFEYDNERYVVYRVPVYRRLHLPIVASNGRQIRYRDYDMESFMPAYMKLSAAKEVIQTMINLKSHIFAIRSRAHEQTYNENFFAKTRSWSEEINEIRRRFTDKLDTTIVDDPEIRQKIEFAKISVRAIPDIPDADIQNMAAAMSNTPYKYILTVSDELNANCGPDACWSLILTGILLYTTANVTYSTDPAFAQLYENQSTSYYENIMNALIRINIGVESGWCMKMSQSTLYSKVNVLTHLCVCILVDLVTQRHSDWAYVQGKLPAAVDTINKIRAAVPALKYVRNPEDIAKLTDQDMATINMFNYGDNPSQSMVPFVFTLNFSQRVRIAYNLTAYLEGMKQMPLFTDQTRMLNAEEVLELVELLSKPLEPYATISKRDDYFDLEQQVFGVQPELGSLYNLAAISDKMDKIFQLFKIPTATSTAEDQANLEAYLQRHNQL
jgi:hypothetical protein